MSEGQGIGDWVIQLSGDGLVGVGHRKSRKEQKLAGGGLFRGNLQGFLVSIFMNWC
ncbi:MAG: hypothetical protein ACJA16_000120 [Akkermansiaceae bacterium]